MRCTICGNVLRHAFNDDVNDQPVYQCSTVGVESVRTIGRDSALIKTLDHSDFFFIRNGAHLERVKPVRLTRAQSEMLLKRVEYPFEKDEFTRKRIVPTCWTTARA